MSILLVHCEHQASKVGESMMVFLPKVRLIQLKMSLLSLENEFTSINDIPLRQCGLLSFARGLFLFFIL